jgi:hypothetical protein
VIGYDVAQWHDLFVAVAGAAAALTGLIFVAVSINLKSIMESPILPARAAESLGILIVLLVISILVLTPGQSRQFVGAELTAIAVLVLARVGVSRAYRRGSPEIPLHWILLPAVVALLSSLPLLLAGITLLAHRGGGLYWLVPELIFGFVGAVYNAWILLVEILR